MVEITKGDDKLVDQLQVPLQLQSWFKTQTKWKTKKEFAESIGIKYSTLKKYFQGAYRPTKENRQKLYEVTGIEILKGEIGIKGKEKSKTLPDSSKLVEESKEAETFDNMKNEIIEIQNTLLNLNERLDGFTGICEKCIANKLPRSKEDCTIEERVVIVKELVYSLNRELEFFKKGSPESREIFGDSIYAPDVGYIMALFKALFDEDKFQTWLLMSSYEMKRG